MHALGIEPSTPVADALSADRTGTLRLVILSNRSVMLRGRRSPTTASTPSGNATSSGRRSTTTVSGAFAPIGRRITGGLSVSLMSSLGEPATIACRSGTGSRSTSELSSSGTNRTGTRSTCGSLTLTTNHSTRVTSRAVPLSARCWVNRVTTRRCSEVERRGAAAAIADPPPNGRRRSSRRSWPARVREAARSSRGSRASSNRRDQSTCGGSTLRGR